MNKLYTVTLETEIVVLAESEEAACSEARAALHNLSSDEFDVSAYDLRALPASWSEDLYPYGKGEETIAELIAAGAAPRYVK